MELSFFFHFSRAVRKKCRVMLWYLSFLWFIFWHESLATDSGSQIAARQSNLAVNVNLGYSIANFSFSGRPINFTMVGSYFCGLLFEIFHHKYPTAVVYTTCFINRGTPNTNSSSTALSKQKQTTLLCYKRCQQPFTFYAPFGYLWLRWLL